MISDGFGNVNSADMIVSIKDVDPERNRAIVKVQAHKAMKLWSALAFATKYKGSTFRIRINVSGILEPEE